MSTLLAQLDYQEEALDALERRATKGIYRNIGVMATGLGKTAGVAAHVPRRFEHWTRRQAGGHGGLLFIVHRREILFDAAATFKAAYPDAWIGIEMGDLHAVGDEDFIFASADSIGTIVSQRIKKMSRRYFGAIITDECFSGDTRVMTEDGLLPIGKLVEWKYGGKIKGLSPDGTYVWQRASDWIEKPPSGPMMEVRVGRASKIRATANHEWLTPAGYVRTDRLAPGAAVYCDPDFREAVRALTDDGRQIVLSGLVGDGTIGVPNGNSINPRMTWTQREDRRPYLDEKFRVLGWTPTFSRQRSGYSQASNIARAVGPCSPELREYRALTPAEAIQRLTPLGLAHYFGDDGSHSGTATYSISAVKIGAEGREALVAKLAEYGVVAHARAESVTITGGENLRAFERLVGPHLHPSVRYKLIGDAPAWTPPPAPETPFLTSVIEVASAAPTEKVYCLRMEGVPNFMVGSGGFVVHNCHHLTTDSKWDNILNYFGVGSDPNESFRLPNGDKPLSILLTATPNRTDGKGLAPFLDPDAGGAYTPAFEYDYAWGVRNGWVVDVRAHHLVDESGARGQGKEATTEIDFLCRVVRDYCADLKTLVFAKNVEQSQVLAATLNAKGIARAFHVDGMTDKDARREAIEAYKRGGLDLLSNYGVFTEGTNVPGIQAAILNRIVKSPVLFPQMVGRITRPHPEANVYVLKTAAERRAAIAASPKPFGQLFCVATPEEWADLNIVAQLTGKDTKIAPSNGQTIMEVLDYIENVETEMPEAPIREFEGTLDDLKIRLKEVDPWTRTVYNDDLKALSALSWVQTPSGDYALWLPNNPFSSRPADQTPTVVQFVQQPDGTVAKRLVTVGGWNSKTKKVHQARVQEVGQAPDLNSAVRQLEGWMKKKAPSTFRSVLRGGHEPADPKKVKYLKNKGIRFDGHLTDATADLLMADARVRSALDNVTR